MVSPADEVPRGPSLRSLVAVVYLPTFLFAVGQGAVIPIIALSAQEMGASVALAATAVAMRGIGTMFFDMPAGALIERVGERRAMTIGTFVLIAALGGCYVSSSVYMYLASVFVLGCGWAIWMLARVSYVADVMPVSLRGRALSTLGGVNRIGNFVGPLVGAVVISFAGLGGVYVFHAFLAVAGLATLARLPGGDTGGSRHHPTPRVASVIRSHARVLLTAGIGAMCLSVLRASRYAILPLWGANIGLSPQSISVIFGVASAMDMALFYPAGVISDRLGRKFVAVPCLLLMAIGFVAIPATSGVVSLTLAGLAIGAGNGMGSGIVMTLGADFAPDEARASFLGVWRLVSDMGQAGGPLLVAALGAATTLGAASVFVGGVGVVGAAMFAFAMPETLRLTQGSDSPTDST